MPTSSGSRYGYSDFTLNTAIGTTPEMDLRQFTDLVILIPNGSTITSLTFHTAKDSSGTYKPLHTSAGVAITMTVAADKAYRLPPEVVACGFVKAVANFAGAVEIFGKMLF